MTTIKDRLVKCWGDNILYNSALKYDGAEQFMRSVCKRIAKVNNGVAIEIGTYNGITSALISEYFQKVYTIDIESQVIRHDVWDLLGTNNVKSIIVSDNEQKKELIKQIKKENEVHFAYIDGDHWNGQPEYDHKLCSGIPFVLFHDYNPVHTEVVNYVDNIVGHVEIGEGFALHHQDK